MADEKVETIHTTGIFSGRLFNRAIEYLDACELLDPQNNDRFKHVAFYTLSHSVELALKSFLSAKGIDRKELQSRTLGHNLEKLHQRSIVEGLGPVELLENLIDHLRAMTMNDEDPKKDEYALRYPFRQLVSVPEPDHSIAVARSLLATVKPVVMKASISEHIKIASDPNSRGKRRIE